MALEFISQETVTLDIFLIQTAVFCMRRCLKVVFMKFISRFVHLVCLKKSNLPSYGISVLDMQGKLQSSTI